MSNGRPKLGQILKAAGLVNDLQLKEALKTAQQQQVRIGEALVSLGHIDEASVSKALGKQHKIPFVDLAKYKDKLGPDLIARVPQAIVAEFQLVPVQLKGNKLIVASVEPLDLMVLDNLRFTLGCEVQCALATPTALNEVIDAFYTIDEDQQAWNRLTEEATITDIDYKRGDGDTGKDAEAEDSNLIKLVNMIITDAVKGRASDIHVEPMESKLRLRYRVDGVCAEVEPPPKRLQGPILARLKIMSDMDIAEKRKTQDGRIKMRFQDRDIDLRVNSLPARHGESIVMRILDKEKALVDLEELGLHPNDFERFNRIIKKPNGIFLVTGPTGSGKTTTLYAALKKLNQTDIKIITAENPVEYNITGLNQCQVNHKIGLDFVRILRSMLRQAPNIILVGEIRDKETADTAIQAALTGHLVFSTLHTNDAPGALTRLIDMGVKPFLVSSAVQAVLAQRLVRLLCKDCKEPVIHTEAELRTVGLQPEDVRGRTTYGPNGCPSCSGKGYRGRMGCYELLEMTPPMRELTFKKSSSITLRNEARISGGMLTLQEDGVRKVLEGRTTIEEILSITHRAD
ncbi:MAG: GspE/PulE family protein [Planctomycetota bacterium]